MNKLFSTKSDRVFIIAALVIPLVHLCLGYIGLSITFVNGASVFWPSLGIFLVAMLVVGYRVWPILFLSDFIVSYLLFFKHNILISSLIAGVNLITPFVATFLIHRVIKHYNFLQRSQDVFKFIILTIPSPLASSVLAAVVLCASGIAPWTSFLEVCRTWLISDSTGILVITPLLLAWFPKFEKIKIFKRQQIIELAFVLTSLIIVSYIAFSGGYPIEYTIVPPLIWSAIRFEARISTLLVAIVSAIAIFGTVQGFGSFAKQVSANQSLILLQSFICVIAITTFILSGVTQETRKAEKKLRQANNELEQRVEIRTQELRQQKAWFDAFFEAANAGFSIVDKDLRYVQVNEAIAEIHGASLSEHVGKTLRDILPKLAPNLEPIYQHILTVGEPLLNVEVSGETASQPGEKRNWIVSYFPLPGLDDKPMGVGAVVVEITKLKQIEEKLRQSEALLSMAQKVAHVGSWEFNLLTGKTTWSEEMFHIYGLDSNQSEPTYTELLEFIYPEDRVYFEASINRAMIKGISYEKDFRIIQPNGLIRYLEAKGKPVFNEKKQVIKLFGAALDITERKLAEAALTESESKYRHLVETSQDMIFSCNREGRFTFVNSAVKHIHGYEPSEMIDRPFTDFQPPEEIAKDIQAHQRLLAGESLFQYESVHLGKDGRRINLLFNAIVLCDSEGNVLGTTGTASDITERKLAEDALRRSEVKLKAAKEAADRANQAKSEFLSKMSHELRTPLNAILGFTQILVRSHSLTPEQQEHLGIISRAGEHLLTLINDVLEMSKIEAGKIEIHENSFDLTRLLDSLNEMFKLKTELKGLQLIFEHSINLPQYIKTDESKLRQVLINLLGNAIKFTEQGGVLLRVSRNDCNEEIKLIFEIEDTGFGISSEELEILFNPFIQTSTGKKSQSGTGLGLPISRQFVQLMGGEIIVISKLGKGSIFKFDIKIKLAEPIEVPTPKLSPKAIGLEPNQPSYRILVVDDVWESRLLLIHLLSPLGFEVRQATNGQEAIAIWQEWQPHLIWMDMQMPVLNGYEAAQQIKSQAKEKEIIPVIIALTASAFDENRAMFLERGCDDFVSKPFREEIIFEKIMEYLGVRYIYEEPSIQKTTKSSLSAKVTVDELKSEDLAVMPESWLIQLYHAASALDDELVTDLIASIRELRPDLANSIAKLAKELRFDKIIDLIPKFYLEN